MTVTGFIIHSAAAAILFTAGNAGAGTSFLITDTLVYRDSTVSSIVTGKRWMEQKDNQLIFLYRRSDSSHYYTAVDTGFDAYSWKVVQPENNTRCSVHRSGNRLVTEGICKGKPIEKQHTIDSLPWYPTPDFCLIPFVQSPDKKTVFWVTNPLSFHHFRVAAIKTGTESVTVNDSSHHCIKIKLTSADWRSIFWAYRYWFRQKDGVLIKHEAVRGGPGTPKSTVSYIRKNHLQ